MGQVSLGNKTVGKLPTALPAMVVNAIGGVALEEEVGVEVCRSLEGTAEAVTLHKVLRENRVDGSDVELRRLLGVGARFHKVFDKRLGNPDEHLVTLELLHFLHETLHAFFRVGEFARASCLPELGALHTGIVVLALIALEVKFLIGYGREVKGGVFRGALNLHALSAFDKAEFHNHIVARQDLFARGEGLKFLHHTHGFHKVDVGAVGDGDVGTVHTVGRVCHDIQMTRETEVLRIVGRKGHIDAAAPINIEGVHQEVAVKTDGVVRRERTDEGVLQEAHLVVVDVYRRKAVLQHRVEDVARSKNVVDAVGALTQNDAFLRVCRFAVNLAHHAFIYGDGQDALSRVVTGLHVVEQEGVFLRPLPFRHVVGDVVDREHEFVVLLQTVEVVRLECPQVFPLNHLLHELYGGVVLTAVPLFLPHDGGSLNLRFKFLKHHVQSAGTLRRKRLGVIPHKGEGQFARLKGDRILPLLIRLHRTLALVIDVDVRQWFPRPRIGNRAGNLLCQHAQGAG